MRTSPFVCFRWLLLSISLLLVVPVRSVTAASLPPLPPAHFVGYAYRLPPNFRPTDSTQLWTQLRALALDLARHQDVALTKYTIADTALLADLLRQRADAALYLEQPAAYLRYSRRAGQLAPLPDYQSPRRLIWGAWAQARTRLLNDHEAAFDDELRPALAAVFDSVAPAFRDDILNAQKGNYEPASTALNRRGLLHVFEQVGPNRQLDYFSATNALAYALGYKLRRDHRAVIEKWLYSRNPARVTDDQVFIPLRDGVKLRGFVFRDVAQPAGQRVPALVSLSPYPGGQEATRGNVFATNGYAYVYVDTRGRRDSQGKFFPYEHDAQDFYDVIDWISKQPWCDGQVATTGGSYLGFVQWQAIRKEFRHPALKAINPMVAVGFGVDFPRESHVFYPYILQWATFVSGKELNEAQFYDYNFWNRAAWNLYREGLPFQKLDSVAGLPNPYFQKWVSHPDFDAYWRGILPKPEDYAALDLPVLTITGYYDGDQNGALYYYNQHLRHNPLAYGRHHLLIGPYEHGAAQWAPGSVQAGMPLERAAQVPIYKQVIEWFDWNLKKAPQPAWIKDRVTYFATATGQWRGAPSLPALTTDTLHLYLTPTVQAARNRPDGFRGLAAAPPAKAAELVYKHDIAQTIDSTFLFASTQPFSDSITRVSPYNLVFESAPLPKAVLLSGRIVPRIFASLNVPDADFRVSIYEQTADGRALPLGTSCLRARYRLGGEKPKLLKKGRVERFDFTDNYVYVKKLAAGSRLRFVFEVQNRPDYERNYGFGGVVARERAPEKPRIIETTLQMSRKYPSRVDIPVAAE